MTTHRKHWLALGACVLAALAMAESAFACNHNPIAYVSDWSKHEPLGDVVQFDGSSSYDPDAGDTLTYSWSFPAEAYSISGQTSSISSCRFNAAGSYNVTLWVTDNHNAKDYDYASVYVVEVASVTQSGTGATSIWVPVNGSASLQASPNPSISWPSGKPTWSITSQPGGASASVTPGSSGAATLNNMTVPGLYRAKAVCGSLDDGASIDVTAIDVQIDTTFPATVAVGGTLSLNCTARGDTTGAFTWSKVSGPGTVTFSLNANTEDPGFSASLPGSYTVQVQYTKGGATVTKTSGTITVAAVAVDAAPASGTTTYVKAGNTLQLDCTPSGITNGMYSWSKDSGPGTVTFSNPTAKNPMFSATQTGSYVVRVQYTAGGTTVSDISGTITVFAIDALPSSGTMYFASGIPRQLDSTLSPTGLSGGTYNWSKASGTGSVTFSNTTIKNPTFSATQVGNYTARAQYIIGGVIADDITSTLTVFDAPVTTPSSAAYVGLGNSLQLDCTPTTTGGTYSWSKGSGPGTVTFSPVATQKNPTFTATAAGAYVALVQYTLGGASIVRGSSSITVFDVNVSAPSFPAYVGVGNTLQLDCTPTTTGGTYSWFQIYGPATGTFSDSSAPNPTFTATVPGSYVVRVQYTIGSASVGESSGTIYVVEVGSLAESTTGQDPIYVAAGPSAVANLTATANPAGSWPTGQPAWSVQTQPAGAAASIVPGSNGAAAMINLTTAGLYQAKAVCGPADDGDRVDVTAFQVGITAQVGGGASSSLPLTVGAGATVTLNGNPSPDVGGTYVWTATPPEGRSLLNSTSPNPTLIINQPGTYTVRVDYTKQYGPSSSTGTATGTVTASVVSVGISLPQGLHGYVAPYNALQLDCTPSGILGGTYHWSQVLGPSTGSFLTDNIHNPTFTGGPPGVYEVKVDYTVGGVTVASDPATIGVVAVTVDAPANGALTIKAGAPLTLSCTPLPLGAAGTDYSWTVAAPGTVTPATEQSTVFSSAEPNHYVAAVQCKVGGVPVGDATNVISVIGVGEIWAICGADYNDTELTAYLGDTVTLCAYPSPEYYDDWPAETPIWSLAGPAGTIVPCFGTYGPVATLDGLTETGAYTVTAHCGTSTKSITVNVNDRPMITSPSSFPAFVRAGDSLQLDCTPLGQPGGMYTWSQVSGPNQVIFSDSSAKNPLITVPDTGEYVVRVQYTAGGFTFTETSGRIIGVAVGIALDAGGPSETYLNSGEVRKLSLCVHPGYANLELGQGILEAVSGGERIRAWQDEARTIGVNLPALFPLSQWSTSIPIWIEAIGYSSTWDDIRLRWSFTGPDAVTVAEDTLSLTAVDANVAVTTPVPYADASEPNVVVPLSLAVESSLPGGLVELRQAGTCDPSSIRVWTDEARTQQAVLPHTWDLSQPGTTVPAQVYLEFVGLADSGRQAILDLTYARDPNMVLANSQLAVTSVRVWLGSSWLGNTTIQPSLTIPISLGISPTPPTGHVELTAVVGSDYVQIWADEARTQPISLPATWSFPGAQLPSEVYVEGRPSDSNMPVRLDLAYHVNPVVTSVSLDMTNSAISSYPTGITVEFGGGRKAAVVYPGAKTRLMVWVRGFSPSWVNPGPPPSLPLQFLRFTYDGAQWNPDISQNPVPPPGDLQLWWGGTLRRRISDTEPGSGVRIGDFVDGCGKIFLDWINLDKVTQAEPDSVVPDVIVSPTATPGSHTITVGLYDDDQGRLSSPHIADLERLSDEVTVEVPPPGTVIIGADILDLPPAGKTFASGICKESIKMTLNDKTIYPEITDIPDGKRVRYVPSPGELLPVNVVELWARDLANADAPPGENPAVYGNPVHKAWSFPRP